MKIIAYCSRRAPIGQRDLPDNLQNWRILNESPIVTLGFSPPTFAYVGISRVRGGHIKFSCGGVVAHFTEQKFCTGAFMSHQDRRKVLVTYRKGAFFLIFFLLFELVAQEGGRGGAMHYELS